MPRFDFNPQGRFKFIEQWETVGGMTFKNIFKIDSVTGAAEKTTEDLVITKLSVEPEEVEFVQLFGKDKTGFPLLFDFAEELSAVIVKPPRGVPTEEPVILPIGFPLMLAGFLVLGTAAAVALVTLTPKPTRPVVLA